MMVVAPPWSNVAALQGTLCQSDQDYVILVSSSSYCFRGTDLFPSASIRYIPHNVQHAVVSIACLASCCCRTIKRFGTSPSSDMASVVHHALIRRSSKRS